METWNLKSIVPFLLLSCGFRWDTGCDSSPCSLHMMSFSFLSGSFQGFSLVFLSPNLILLYCGTNVSKHVPLGGRSALRVCMLAVSFTRFREFSVIVSLKSHSFLSFWKPDVICESLCYSLTRSWRVCAFFCPISLFWGVGKLNRSLVKSLAFVWHHFYSMTKLQSLSTKF